MISKEAEAYHAQLKALADNYQADPGELPPPFDIKSFRPQADAFLQTLGVKIPLKRERVNANGVPVVWVTPEGSTGDVVVFYTHGGGYAIGNTDTHENIAAWLARALNGRALQVDYRLSPEHHFPAPIEDCVTAYKWLLEQGQKPGRTIISGESAGGCLCITTQLLARQKGLPLPAAAYVMSPSFDLEAKIPSYDYNAGKDLSGARDTTILFAAMYYGDQQKIDQNNPLSTPLNASLKGIAPMYVQVGGDEVLKSDTEIIVANAKRDGVEAVAEVDPHMQHMYQMHIGSMPEADRAVARGVEFLKTHLK